MSETVRLHRAHSFSIYRVRPSSRKMPSVDGRFGPERWFTERCAEVMRCRSSPATHTFQRCIKACFGTSLQVITKLDRLLENESPSEREHLLWALHMLKVYNSEYVSASLWNVTPKTYRKWVHSMITRIADLDLVG